MLRWIILMMVFVRGAQNFDLTQLSVSYQTDVKDDKRVYIRLLAIWTSTKQLSPRLCVNNIHQLALIQVEIETGSSIGGKTQTPRLPCQVIERAGENFLIVSGDIPYDITDTSINSTILVYELTLTRKQVLVVELDIDRKVNTPTVIVPPILYMKPNDSYIITASATQAMGRCECRLFNHTHPNQKPLIHVNKQSPGVFSLTKNCELSLHEELKSRTRVYLIIDDMSTNGDKLASTVLILTVDNLAPGCSPPELITGRMEPIRERVNIYHDISEKDGNSRCLTYGIFIDNINYTNLNQQTADSVQLIPHIKGMKLKRNSKTGAYQIIWGADYFKRPQHNTVCLFTHTGQERCQSYNCFNIVLYEDDKVPPPICGNDSLCMADKFCTPETTTARLNTTTELVTTSSVTVKSIKATKQPSTTTEQPSTNTEQPSTTAEQSLTTIEQPSTTIQLSSIQQLIITAEIKSSSVQGADNDGMTNSPENQNSRQELALMIALQVLAVGLIAAIGGAILLYRKHLRTNAVS